MARTRLKAKGRREFGTFVALPKDVLESLAYAALTAFEVKLLLDLFCQHNGRNNGDYSAAWAIMQRRGWNSQDTLHRALRGLLDKGFIQRTRQGGRNLCSLYSVTWLSVDVCENKLDIRPTGVAAGTWKNKTLLREPEYVDTPPVAMPGKRHAN
jgi:hypothetical protein